MFPPDPDSPDGAATDDTDGTDDRPTTDEHGRIVTESRNLSGMRRTIATRLHESYRNAVHVTASRDVDAESVLSATAAAGDRLEVDVSPVDLVLRALSATLDEHPAFNATFEDDEHVVYEGHDVAVAVEVEAGLVTPVLRDLDSRNLEEIAAERRSLTQSVQAGEYTMRDLQGATFTLTNLGVLGVDSFTPVINPPQVAILGVGRIRERACPGDDGVEFRHRIPYDLSFDHRVVDGADAARFLDTLAGHTREVSRFVEDR